MRVICAPFDVYLVKPGQDVKEAESIVKPDLCIICDPGKVKKFGCVGAPDLIVEILSPSTSVKDVKLKFELYEEFEVREYWIVSPEKRSAVVHVLENEKYEALPPVSEYEQLNSVIFPALHVNLLEVFRHVKD